MKKLSKILSVGLSLAMCLTLLPLTVFADGADPADPEICEHDWNWVQTTAPDCLNGGEETYTCTKCGTTDGTRPVSALAHDYTQDDIIAKVPATCTEPGVKAHYTCGRCGGTFGTGTAAITSLEIKPLGHSWGEWTVTKEATTEEAGLETRTCTRAGCGETEEKEIPQLAEEPGHVHSWNTSQWHYDDDNHYHYCTLAGCDARTDEAAHTYDASKSGKCTVCGKYHDHTGKYVDGKCSVCGVPCWHFNRDEVEHSDATCLHEGTIAYFYCRDCGQYISLEGDSRGKPVTSTAIPKDSGNHDEDCALAYVDNGDGTHDQKYTCGVIVVDGEAHADEDSDNHCDKCNAVISSASGETTDPTDPINPAPQPGTEISNPSVPLGELPDDAEVEIEDVDVPLAGLMTRAEFVNYLYVQAGSPAAELSSFTDVAEDDEYAIAIGWAQAAGIAKGVGNSEFAPDDLVTVEQARLFLERYAQFQGFEMPELAALAGKERDEILDNADEVLTEFFGEEL